MPRLNETGAFLAMAASVGHAQADALRDDPMEQTQVLPVAERRYRMHEAKLFNAALRAGEGS